MQPSTCSQPDPILGRLRYRIYPPPGQQVSLSQAFGCARVVRNDAPWRRARRRPERAWLGDGSASMVQRSLRDLDQALGNRWLRCGNARAPRFKRRHNRRSIPICGKAFRTTDQGVHFPKIGEPGLRWSRFLPAVPSSVTIIKDRAGRSVASFVVAGRTGTITAQRQRHGR